MPEMPDVVAGEAVASDWGNDIRDRTVQRYADAAARDASVPFPLAGDLAYLDDSGTVTLFDGTTWKSGTAPGVYVLVAGDTMVGDLTMAGPASVKLEAGGHVFIVDDPANASRVGNRGYNDGRYEQMPSTLADTTRGTVAPPGFNVVWNPTGSISFSKPGHWGSYLLIARASVQTAGGVDTFQTRARIQTNGSAQTSWNQSGNSAAHSLTTCSTSFAGQTAGAASVVLEAIVDDTGGTAPTVTKYAELSAMMIRET